MGGGANIESLTGNTRDERNINKFVPDYSDMNGSHNEASTGRATSN